MGSQKLPLRLTMGGQGANQITPQQCVSTGDRWEDCRLPGLRQRLGVGW